ncbi:MAG: WG repeat-containing protein [Planctomycetota bacterium]
MRKSFFRVLVCLFTVSLLPGCTSQSDALYPYWRGGQVGYIDVTGEVVIPARFHRGEAFGEGMAVVATGGKAWDRRWGVIDATGEYLIPPSHRYPLAYRNGRWIMIEMEEDRHPPEAWLGQSPIMPSHSFNGLRRRQPPQSDWQHYLLTDGYGEQVLPREYRALRFLSDDRIAYRRPGRDGVMDRNGEELFICGIDYIAPEHQGVIVYRDYTHGYMLVDTLGQPVVDTGFLYIAPFHQGRAFARDADGIGVIDTSGTWLARFEGFTTNYFRSELLQVSPPHDATASGEVPVGFHLLGLDGKQTEYRVEGVGPRSQGLYPIVQGGLVGYIDDSFNIVIPCQFKVAAPEPNPFGGAPVYDLARYCFWDGLAPMEQDGKWGYIDRDGDWVIAPQFRKAAHFQGELALVISGLDVGYINRRGEFVWKARLNQAVPGGGVVEHLP